MTASAANGVLDICRCRVSVRKVSTRAFTSLKTIVLTQYVRILKLFIISKDGVYFSLELCRYTQAG